MSNHIDLIVVGKLKDKSFEAIEQEFVKRIRTPSLKIHELKANAENKDIEGKAILKKIDDLSKNSFIVALTEFGKEYDSPAFSRWLFGHLELGKNIIFIIAGAEGFSNDIMSKVDAKLSLSKLTFPHKFARIILLEQVYRAITIKENHPYHN